METILITGGYGFVASNFIERLQQDADTRGKYKIINVDNMSTGSNPYNIPPSLKDHVFIKGDFCNHELIKKLLTTYKISIIYHFGAQTHVDRSFDNPMDFVYSNFVGTANLLDCAVKYGRDNLKKFIYVSTDEVTGSATDDKSDIIYDLGLYDPTNPYSATKAGAELLVNSYYYSFKLPVIITRANNIYGKKQFPEKIIPKFVKLLIDGEKCVVYGQGAATRNYLHVDDAVDAYKLIMTNGETNQFYEMHSHTELSALNITKRIIELVKNDGHPFEQPHKYDKYIEFIEDRPFHDVKYRVNPTSLHELGWSQKVSFELGLERTVNYYVEMFKAEQRLKEKSLFRK
jgi:dTDP-glucose 4,6-dehydratase